MKSQEIMENHKKWSQLMHEIALELSRNSPDNGFIEGKLAQAMKLTQMGLDNIMTTCNNVNVTE